MNNEHLSLINSAINVNKSMIPKESAEDIITMLKNKYPNYSIWIHPPVVEIDTYTILIEDLSCQTMKQISILAHDDEDLFNEICDYIATYESCLNNTALVEDCYNNQHLTNVNTQPKSCCCPNCGAPQKLNAPKCEYCDSLITWQ
jgi:hypothetical protein